MALIRIASILILATSSLFMKPANAQTNPIAGPPNPLYAQVFTADSTAFAALNAHNLSQLMSFFTTDVEFYNDGGGVTTYQQTSLNFGNMFKGAPDIRRELVTGSLEVYPLQGYGAIAIGAHRFCHTEKGKQACGRFKFTTIWQQKEGSWKMARVVSYGH